MKKITKTPGSIWQFLPALFAFLIVLTWGCQKEGEDTVPAELPEVITHQVTDITYNSAKSGGEVTDDGEAEIIYRGVLWNTAGNPTVDDNEGVTSNGKGMGEFSSNVTGLSPSTTYYLRAYAVNSEGAAYGGEIEFTTDELIYEPGQSYYGRHEYIEYIYGNIPLIISVPHGGYDEPASIPDRSCGVTVRDSYTLELAHEIRDIIYDRTGYYPHIIISNLRRTKLDPNRAVYEATCNNSQAETPYYEYHDYIKSAKDTVEKIHGKGLLIDLHGHGHDIQRLELGYAISSSELRLSDSELNSQTYIDKSSIKNLVYNNPNNYTLADLLRGPAGLGGMFDNEEIPAVPGFLDPYPLEGEAYFNGGYITRVHGSRDGGNIDAIQIECHRDVRFTTSERLEFADGLVEAVFAFIDENYFEGFSNDPGSATAKTFNDNNRYSIQEPVNDYTAKCFNPVDSFFAGLGQ